MVHSVSSAPILWVVVLALTAACQPVPVAGPTAVTLGEDVVRLRGDGPPPSPNGECWANSVTPAIIETVTEQQLISEEIRDETGAVISPASFRTRTQQRMVQDREEVWFRAPCPDEQTVAYIASVQRALKARGFYTAEVTGLMDDTTAEAIRRYQAGRGLESAVLSLAAAQALGISAVARDDL
jgi:hypothetical protein